MPKVDLVPPISTEVVMVAGHGRGERAPGGVQVLGAGLPGAASRRKRAA